MTYHILSIDTYEVTRCVNLIVGNLLQRQREISIQKGYIGMFVVFQFIQ